MQQFLVILIIAIEETTGGIASGVLENYAKTGGGPRRKERVEV